MAGPLCWRNSGGSGGGLDDGTFGGEVATENGGAALLGEWFVEGEDDVVVINFGAVEAFAEGLSEDRGDVEMEKVSDAVEEAREAAGVEEVGHDVFAGRSKIGEDGSLAAKSRRRARAEDRRARVWRER